MWVDRLHLPSPLAFRVQSRKHIPCMPGLNHPKLLLKAWQFQLIYNNFVGSNSDLSLPNLAWKYKINIETIKLTFWHQYVKLWRHICWRPSYVHFKLERTIQGKSCESWKNVFLILNMSWEMTFWIGINSYHKNGVK